MDLLAAGSVVCVTAGGGGDGCTAWEREECIGRLPAWSGRIMRACDEGMVEASLSVLQSAGASSVGL